jgi:hypothetical protein
MSMKKNLLVYFISLPFLSFSQSGFETHIPDSIPIESLREFGGYKKTIDLFDNRIDTLLTNSKGTFTRDDKVRFEEYNSTIYFYEYDNLLVLNSDSPFDKKLMFLDFLYEEGSFYSVSKYYLTEKGEKIIFYYDVNESDKKLSTIYFYSTHKNEYCITYTRRIKYNQEKIKTE